MNRLPRTQKTSDKGFIYVVQRGNAYKIGFTRNGLMRRTRNAGGSLVLTIPTGQRPAILEYLINNRFAAKRLPPQGEKSGDRREWFALDAADLAWLRGLSGFMAETVEHASERNPHLSDAR